MDVYKITQKFNEEEFKEVAIYSHKIDGITLEPNCDIEEVKKFVKRWLLNKRRIFVVNTMSSIVGYSVAMRSNAGYTLMKVWVQKEHRGKDLGRDLVLINESHAKKIGENKIVGKTHKYTVAFFESLGYTVEENTAGNFHLFEKTLDK